MTMVPTKAAVVTIALLPNRLRGRPLAILTGNIGNDAVGSLIENKIFTGERLSELADAMTRIL